MVVNNSTIQDETTTSLETTEFRIIRITLYVLILFLSCIGNSLVAVVIIKARGMRTSSNVLILSLAVCDFLTPVLSIPFDMAYEEKNYIWPFGRVMCKALWPLQTASSTSSSLILAAISLDRFRTLVKPLSWYISLGKLVVCVLSINAVSIFICIPYFVVLKYSASERSCQESWPGEDYKHAYTIFLFLCQYALPLLTMSTVYILIYISLRSNLVRLFSMDAERGSRAFSRESTRSTDSRDFRRREQNIRLAKMFVIVVVVFAISMFPNQVLWFWIDFGNGRDHHVFHYISVVCRLCTYANSVLNPFIYALKSKEFRSGFAKIGRATVMKPLRKISTDGRKFVRKLSGNVLERQRPIPVEMKSSAAAIVFNENCGEFQHNSHAEECGDIKPRQPEEKNDRTNVMQPLRKLSNETRKYVRKFSGTVSPDSQIPMSVQRTSSAGLFKSSENENAGAFQFSRQAEVTDKTKGNDDGSILAPRRRKFSCYGVGYGKEQKDLSMKRRPDDPSQEMTENKASKSSNEVKFMKNKATENINITVDMYPDRVEK